MEIIRVNLGKRSYSIHLGEKLPQVGRIVKELDIGKKILLVSDSKVFHYYGEIVKKV